jgi:cilia- and flagella-associated protein 251
MEAIVAPIVCSAVRPYSNTLVISCENGVLYEWNFIEKPKSISVLRSFGTGEMPTCATFSPKGKYLSVATKIGTIHIYEVEIGEWQSSLLVAEVEKSKPYIHMQTFSPDSRHLAVMDEDFGVTLFILGEKNWSLSGKIRVHYAPIRSISFGESIDQRG